MIGYGQGSARVSREQGLLVGLRARTLRPHLEKATVPFEAIAILVHGLLVQNKLKKILNSV